MDYMNPAAEIGILQASLMRAKKRLAESRSKSDTILFTQEIRGFSNRLYYLQREQDRTDKFDAMPSAIADAAKFDRAMAKKKA